jgi:hypothetical protein
LKRTRRDTPVSQQISVWIWDPVHNWIACPLSQTPARPYPINSIPTHLLHYLSPHYSKENNPLTGVQPGTRPEKHGSAKIPLFYFNDEPGIESTRTL